MAFFDWDHSIYKAFLVWYSVQDNKIKMAILYYWSRIIDYSQDHMKKIWIMMSIMIFSFGLSGQSIIEDAFNLSKYLVPTNKEKPVAIFDPQQNTEFRSECLPILERYLPEGAQITETSELLKLLEHNPFIGRVTGDPIPFIAIPDSILFQEVFLDTLIFGGEPLDDLEGVAPEKRTSPGGTFVTNLADGLAKFLVKRAKEELTVAFFQKFKNKLTANVYLMELFPQTSLVLQLIDNEIYQYNTYLESLREVFIKDMKTLPTNLKSLLVDDSLISNDRDRIIVMEMLSLGQMLLDNKHPLDFLEYLGEDSQLLNLDRFTGLKTQEKASLHDVGNGFKLTHFISESLRSSSPNEEWVNEEIIKRLTEDRFITYLYLALAWQKSPDIRFSSGTSFRDGLLTISHTSSQLELLHRDLTHFVETTTEVKTTLDTLKVRKRRKEASYADYFQFFRQTFELAETGIQFKKHFFGFTDDQVKEDTRLTRIIAQFNEFHFNIRQKYYSSAVTNVVFILGELLNDDEFAFKADLLRYGNFMANVAKAETSDEVAAAIEAVALPVGSSITKKYAGFSVTLNAYTGLGFGSEYLRDIGAAGTSTHDAFLSVSAPVGIGFNFGFERAGSLGLFTSLIDVGAIAAYRFDDANSADLPELNIKNILAPGGYLIYGFGADLPLSLGVGAQLGPNLRRVGDPVSGSSTAFVELSDGWRWGAFLTVDIPVINLFVR